MPRGVKPKGEEGNVIKYKSYAMNWGGIKKAIGSGHYIEATGIQESIIRDRLLSFLCKNGVLDPATPETKMKSLSNLMDMWKKHSPIPLQDEFFSDLYTAAHEWRKRRNKVAHESVVSLPGEIHEDPALHNEMARQTAVDGERLVKSIQNWYGRVKYQWRQAAKK